VSFENRRRQQDKMGIPDMKKVERTGENTFVVHTHGKDKFEGNYDSRRYDIRNGKIVPK